MIFHACDDVKIRPENERYDTERERERGDRNEQLYLVRKNVFI